MYYYIMLDLAYREKPEAYTVTNDFSEAVELLKQVLKADKEYLKNAYIESHTTEQFEE